MFTRVFQSVLAATALAVALPLQAAVPASLRSVGSAPVVAVQSTRVADLVLLGAGFDASLRAGMVCKVTRGGTAIGEIVLVELRAGFSAALIRQLAPGQSIRTGDVASVNALKT